MTPAFLMAFAAAAAGGAAAAPEPRLPAAHLPVPLVRQATDYSCGAAAMLAALYYWKAFEGPESELYPLLGTTPKDGTDPRSMRAAAERLGLAARLQEGMTLEDLSAALGKGETVILDLQAWSDPAAPPVKWANRWEDGHYVVLVGTDAQHVYVMDPSVAAGYGHIPLTELYERWHDYEDRDGKMWRNQHLGLILSGKEHIAAYPAPLERIR